MLLCHECRWTPWAEAFFQYIGPLLSPQPHNGVCVSVLWAVFVQFILFRPVPLNLPPTTRSQPTRTGRESSTPVKPRSCRHSGRTDSNLILTDWSCGSRPGQRISLHVAFMFWFYFLSYFSNWWHAEDYTLATSPLKSFVLATVFIPASLTLRAAFLKMDYLGSPVINVARLPIFWTRSTARWFQVPPVSMATGWKMCVQASSSYLAILLAAAWFDAAPASMTVSPMCDSA